jgi:hypothetical protein
MSLNIRIADRSEGGGGKNITLTCRHQIVMGNTLPHTKTYAPSITNREYIKIGGQLSSMVNCHQVNKEKIAKEIQVFFWKE